MVQKSQRAKDLVEGLKNLVWLALVLGVLGIINAGYLQADQAGWIRHSANTEVKYPHHGWEIGEYVTCAGVDRILNCEDNILEPGIVREMDVVFWGQVGPKPTIYKCQREENSITCHLNDADLTPKPSN